MKTFIIIHYLFFVFNHYIFTDVTSLHLHVACAKCTYFIFPIYFQWYRVCLFNGNDSNSWTFIRAFVFAWMCQFISLSMQYFFQMKFHLHTMYTFQETYAGHKSSYLIFKCSNIVLYHASHECLKSFKNLVKSFCLFIYNFFFLVGGIWFLLERVWWIIRIKQYLNVF